MNHPVPQQQHPGQAQIPQNAGQQRQAPNAQQKPVQGQQQQQQQQQQQTQYSKYDPQLCLFVLEKTKADKTWEDVQPLKEPIPLQDLQAARDKNRKKRVSVKAALDEITSATVRRLVYELVEDETQKLWEFNKTLQWKIASADVEWEELRRGSRRIKRVSVMLETESSGFPDPQAFKLPTATQSMQDPNKAMKQNGMAPGQQGQMPSQGGNMQQQKPSQQQGHPMAHGQPTEHQRGPPNGAQNHAHGNPNAPPPPPPPPTGHPGHPGHPGQHGHTPNGAHGAHGGPPPPPPPPPGPGHHGHGGQHPASARPNASMPGAYPRSASAHGMKHQPQIEVLEERFMRPKKPRNGNESSSEDDSEEWNDTDGSDGSSRRSRRSYGDEHKTKRQHDKRDRSRKTNRSNKRSSSRVRVRGNIRTAKSQSRNNSQHRKHRRRGGEYDTDDDPSDAKYTSSSSRSDSPHSHRNRHRRHRRSSRDISPTDVYRDKRHSERKHRPHRRSHEGSEASWRGSQTSSAASTGPSSSAYTAQDRVWDEHMRPSQHSHHSHRAPRHYHHNHPGSSSPPRIYTDLNPRYDDRYNDYPHPAPPRRRDSHFDEDYPKHYPSTHTSNPFNTAHHPADHPRHALRRAATYTDPSDTYPRTAPGPALLSSSSTRYGVAPGSGGGGIVDERKAYQFEQLAEALLGHLQEKQRGVPQRAVPQRSYSGMPQSGAGGFAPVDEWDSR